MKLSKKSGYDVYSAELSFAELLAIQGACEEAGGAVPDSVAKTIDWYIENDELPPPGEEKDKDKKDGEEKADATGTEAEEAPRSGSDAETDAGEEEPESPDEFDLVAAADEELPAP